MTARVFHRLAREPSTGPCARCLTVVALALAAGDWHAVDLQGIEAVACDRCARRDDPDGFARLLAWRRMAWPTSRSARA